MTIIGFDKMIYGGRYTGQSFGLFHTNAFLCVTGFIESISIRDSRGHKYENGRKSLR